MSADPRSPDSVDSGSAPSSPQTPSSSAPAPGVAAVADPGAGVPRPKRRTSSRNLVQALGATLGLVFFLVLLVPRPTSVPRPMVDLAASAKAAQQSLSFTPAAVVPEGWTVTSAQVRRDSGDLATWTVNYVNAQGRYVGLMQAGGWNEDWQSSLTHGGTPQGTVQIDGQSWQVFDKPDKQVTSLMRRSDTLTTLVLAKLGGVSDAQVLADSLSPAP